MEKKKTHSLGCILCRKNSNRVQFSCTRKGNALHAKSNQVARIMKGTMDAVGGCQAGNEFNADLLMLKCCKFWQFWVNHFGWGLQLPLKLKLTHGHAHTLHVALSSVALNVRALMLGKFLSRLAGEQYCQDDSCSDFTFPCMWSRIGNSGESLPGMDTHIHTVENICS